MRMLNTKAIPLTFFVTAMFVVILLLWGILESIEAREIPSAARREDLIINPWAMGDSLSDPVGSFFRRMASMPMESREEGVESIPAQSNNTTTVDQTLDADGPTGNSTAVQIDSPAKDDSLPILRVPTEETSPTPEPAVTSTTSPVSPSNTRPDQQEIILPEEDPTLPKPPKPVNFLAPIINEFLPILARSFLKDFLIPRATDVFGFIQSGITTFFQNIALFLAQLFPGLSGLFFRNNPFAAPQQQVSPAVPTAGAADFKNIYRYAELDRAGASVDGQAGHYPSPHSLVPDESFQSSYPDPIPQYPDNNVLYDPTYHEYSAQPQGVTGPAGFFQPGVTVYDDEQSSSNSPVSTQTSSPSSEAVNGGLVQEVADVTSNVVDYKTPLSSSNSQQQGSENDNKPRIRWFTSSRFGDRFEKLRQKELQEQQQLATYRLWRQ